HDLLNTGLITQIDFRVGRGEFCDFLAATAARRAERQLFSDNSNFGDLLCPTHDHGTNGGGFCAPALREGKVLDIGTLLDFPVVGADSRTDGEF
ncbi:hypothetical protein, partial [Klebsiella pneumoniae]|uniref:hypothetical protein n=1 Tax=Klebsiella pneumoniae TaxID=573 RepID=UPI00217519EA